MKKLLSRLLVLTMIFSLALPTSAAEAPKDSVATTVTSEYSMVQELKETETTTLLAEGYVWRTSKTPNQESLNVKS